MGYFRPMSAGTVMIPHAWAAAQLKPLFKEMTGLWSWTKKRAPAVGFVWMPALTVPFPLIPKKTQPKSATFVITG
jgi:hypothetical protein